MSQLALQPPSVRVEIVRPQPERSSLRSDIAGFIGPTRRGPIGRPVRVDGVRDFRRVFGDLDRDHDTTYAIRGYFENGGNVAWVERLADERTPTAGATWHAALAGMPDEVQFFASSPGLWARDLTLTLSFRREGVRGRPELDIFARDLDGSTEALLGLDAWTLPDELAARSVWLRCAPFASRDVAAPPSPRTREDVLAFSIAAFAAPPLVKENYFGALDRMADEPEVAILAMPELHELEERSAAEVVRYAILQAEQLRDRLVLVDLPRNVDEQAGASSVADAAKRWLIATLDRTRADIPWRAAACYFPWVRVDEPLDRARRIRSIAPSGHVAGIISQLDRERGAHHTPAMEPMIGVVDLEQDVSNNDHAVLNEEGVNVLRCVPSRGFAIWGGRTLDRARDQRYVAHRRLVHRLVRAIRRVAEPLVFETNGPELWLQLVRGVTSTLLETWRSGALAGGRADEAFRVQCDVETNPPEEVELGRCTCIVAVAPATPMEFIVLRLALSRDGSLEVLP